MGGVGGLMGKLPGMGQMKEQISGDVAEKEFRRLEAMINSMTRKERRFPAVSKGLT
jgi:signal recognition particle subunit SRP54